MLTSFAPSPMANVTGWPLAPSRISLTMDAFCFGDTRQATTHWQHRLSCSSPSRASSRIRAHSSAVRGDAAGPASGPPAAAAPVGVSWPSRCSSVVPSTTMASSSVHCRRSSSSRTRGRARCSRSCAAASPGVSPSSTSSCVRSASSWHAYPMLIAVSCLSPVSIQTLILASRRSRMVSGTPSCSLSSIAVAPTMVQSRSISSAASANNSSRPSIAFAASLYRASHRSASAADSSRLASTSVRSPSEANAVRCLSSTARCPSARARSNMTLSAPLASSTVCPPGMRTTTLMRLRAEENSFTASTANRRTAPGCVRERVTPTSSRGAAARRS
mmetsp:Transcript_24661/g.79373  ORF Transcript_24661/g.79373 Transcript_24661/m.79373 type:complete len:331 (+) Transcript_24661:1233-2225(+)